MGRKSGLGGLQAALHALKLSAKLQKRRGAQEDDRVGFRDSKDEDCEFLGPTTVTIWGFESGPHRLWLSSISGITRER
jgi:hypothetical protein